MNKLNWGKIIDSIQIGLLIFSLILLTLSLGALILFDILAGMGVMLKLTQGNLMVSTTISFATTGLALSLLTAGQQISKYKGGSKIGQIIFFLGIGVYFLDIYFDSLGADILRYGKFVVGQEIDQIHLLYRILIGGISTVGEPISITMILGMDFIKKIFESATPPEGKTKTIPPKFSTNPPQLHKSIYEHLPRKDNSSKPTTPTNSFPHTYFENLRKPIWWDDDLF